MLSDCSALTESLSGNNLLEDNALSVTVRDLAPRFDDPKQLADELVRRGWLTAYQKELILAGRASELVLGQYVLLDKIGEGGMGAVYKARHRVLKSVRAIKVIRPDRLVSKSAVERFYREAENVARLHHPNIILAHDAGQHGDVHYFVMEYAPGADLGHLLQRCGPLPPADACAYARQAALGLEHARERGLIHRDIKPSNLLVTPEGQVKLLDLGLARVRLDEATASNASLTQDGAVMGTPDYMAPEQAEDSRRVDIRADVYALGCTLYHVLAGRPPFPGGSVMEKLIKHRLEEPRPVEALRGDLPEGLGPVIRKMMAKDPAARFQTPAEAAEALTPFAAGAGRPGISAGDLHGTVPSGLISGLPEILAAGTPVPGEALQHTDAGLLNDESAPTVDYRGAAAARGSTERIPAESQGLQATNLPLLSMASQPVTAPVDRPVSGLQETVFVPPAPPRRKGPLAAAVLVAALVAVAAGGAAYYFTHAAAPSRPGDDGRRADVAPVTPPPPPTTPAEGPKAGAATDPAKAGGSESASATKPDRPPTPPVPPTAPSPPVRARPALAEARELAGDRGELALVRTQGPAVRTGGRGLAWARRHELYSFAPNKGKKAAFSAEGGRVAVGTPADAVLVYSLRENQPGLVATLPELTGNLTDGTSHINAVGLSPDGSRVALATVGRSEKPLDGYPVTTRFNMLIVWEPGVSTEFVYGPRLDTPPGFACLAYSPLDGKEALVGGSLAQIFRWKTASHDVRSRGAYFRHGTGEAVTALAYSGADGRLAASAGVDRLVCVFDTRRSGPAPLTTLQGLNTAGLCVALSPGGQRVLAGGRAGKACLWDIGDEPAPTVPKPAQELAWYDRDTAVTAVAFAQSGKQFATGGDDGTVCLGEVGKPEPVWREAPRAGGGAVLALAFTTDGKSLLVADESGVGEYPVAQDVTARAKPGPAGLDTQSPLAEARGR
jgi:serine/threonine protein kinase/WD40 repeat protein